MAGQTLTLTIASQLQKAGFTEAAEQMRKLQSEIDGAASKTTLWTEATAKLVGALSVTAIVAFYKTAVEEASKAEQSQLRLKTTVENTGTSWEGAKAQVNGFTQALALSSRFAKGDLDDSLRVLIQRTNSVAVAQANLQTVMGISVATGRDLADVADQIGRAANGSQRDLLQLSKEFGINAEKAKDAEFVLGVLEKRFGTLATTEHTTAGELGKMKSAFGEVYESIGSLLLPVVNLVSAAFTKLFIIMSTLNHQMLNFGHIVSALVRKDMVDLEKAWKDTTETAQNFWSVLTGQGAPEKVAASGAKTTAAAHALSEELKAMIISTNQETAKITANLQTDKFAALAAETEAEKAEIRKRADFRVASAEGQAQVLAAIDRNSAAERARIEQDLFKNRLQVAVQFGNAIGVATGKMLMGDQNAWKDASRQIIDMIVAQAQAMIITRSMAGAAAEVAKFGLAGLATGAGLLAWGAAQAAAAAAVGELAKGALGTGGSVSAPSSGGGGGGAGGATVSSSPEAAAPAAAPRAESTVRVNVYGDMYGEPAFVDRLALKISEAVENRDVRLVSTRVGA